MIEYPKIETLYNRDPNTFKVLTDHTRLPEFGLIKRWLVTEKIDGTNVRVGLTPEGLVVIGGRTDKAQMYLPLVEHLNTTFTEDKMKFVFDDWSNWVVLFGEGYGERIQKGGGNYRRGVSFRLFDVLVGDWWLNWEDVENVAGKLGMDVTPAVNTALTFLPSSVGDLVAIVEQSWVAKIENGKDGVQAEGVVARTDPLLFTRNGKRVMWKLKFKDFGKGKHD